MKFVLLRCPQRIGPFPYYFGYYVQRYDDSKFTGHPRNEGRNFWNHLEPCANPQRHQGRKDSGSPVLITMSDSGNYILYLGQKCEHVF